MLGSQGQLIEFEIVSTLKKVVSNSMRRRGAYGEIFAEGFLEHVAGKLASAIIIVMDIEYVEAESAPAQAAL